MRYALILALSALFLAGPSYAAVELKAHVTVDAAVVTLGDLTDGAGEFADVVASEAPAPGAKVQLSAARIVRLASHHGVALKGNLRHITVERSGRAIQGSEVIELVEDQLATFGSEAKGEIQLSISHLRLFAPLDSFDPPALSNFSFDPRSRRFVGRLDIKDTNGKIRSTRLSGRVIDVMSVPVLRSVVSPGDIISKADIGWKSIPRRQVGRNLVLSTTQLIGKTPKRALSPGTVIRTNDVGQPILVDKGAMVSMSIRSANMQLVVTGRALEKGGKGDVIQIMNPKSHITVQAVVVAPNEVRIQTFSGTGAARLTSLK